MAIRSTLQLITNPAWRMEEMLPLLIGIVSKSHSYALFGNIFLIWLVNAFRTDA